mmetsp:Transcript_24117/g.95745  ORF Transcript_24117/g.95745 Transcript_24117/m.95745 type:complete len:252 (+) Transcript_24117:545-1300(+)
MPATSDDVAVPACHARSDPSADAASNTVHGRGAPSSAGVAPTNRRSTMAGVGGDDAGARRPRGVAAPSTRAQTRLSGLPSLQPDAARSSSSSSSPRRPRRSRSSARRAPSSKPTATTASRASTASAVGVPSRLGEKRCAPRASTARWAPRASVAERPATTRPAASQTRRARSVPRVSTRPYGEVASHATMRAIGSTCASSVALGARSSRRSSTSAPFGRSRSASHGHARTSASSEPVSRRSRVAARQRTAL